MYGGNAVSDFLRVNKENVVLGIAALLVLFSLILIARADSMSTGTLFANTVFTLLAGLVLLATAYV